MQKLIIKNKDNILADLNDTMHTAGSSLELKELQNLYIKGGIS
jgi:hypothetical protein